MPRQHAEHDIVAKSCIDRMCGFSFQGCRSHYYEISRYCTPPSASTARQKDRTCLCNRYLASNGPEMRDRHAPAFLQYLTTISDNPLANAPARPCSSHPYKTLGQKSNEVVLPQTKNVWDAGKIEHLQHQRSCWRLLGFLIQDNRVTSKNSSNRNDH